MCDQNLEVIGVGLNCGSPSAGTEKASDTIYSALFPAKNVKYRKIECNNTRIFKNNMFSPTQVKRCVKKLYKLTNNIYERGKTPLLIGGDHSMSIGSVASSMKRFGDDILVVWVDAHTDINTIDSSLSHYIHGMPNAVSMGLTGKALSPCHHKYTLKGNNLVILGARSIDDSEYKILADNGVKYYSVPQIREQGLDKVVAQIKKDTNAKHVHISFDIDCFDPKEVSATGYNIDTGFNLKEVVDIVDTLQKEFSLALFECVEYNPPMDNKNELEKIVTVINKIRK